MKDLWINVMFFWSLLTISIHYCTYFGLVMRQILHDRLARIKKTQICLYTVLYINPFSKNKKNMSVFADPYKLLLIVQITPDTSSSLFLPAFQIGWFNNNYIYMQIMWQMSFCITVTVNADFNPFMSILLLILSHTISYIFSNYYYNHCKLLEIEINTLHVSLETRQVFSVFFF